MKNKNSFLLYCDTIHTVQLLTDEEAGKLFKHILEYVNDKNPQTDDKTLLLAFEPIKQSLKRDLQKFKDIVLKRSAAGQASAKARLKKKTKNSTSVEPVEQVSTNSTVSDSDSVSVSVTVLDSVYEIEKNKFTSDEVFQTFADCVKLFDSKFLPKTLSSVVKWLQEIDRLHRIDGHEFKKIPKVVKWAREDSFWSSNFYTILKFRKTNSEGVKYFDIFLQKMNQKKKNQNIVNKKNSSDYGF